VKFYAVVDQVVELLQTRERVSYRALKREFDLDDDYLEDLKEELIGAKHLASDEEGRFLVWGGDNAPTSTAPNTPPPSQPPSTYTGPLLPRQRPGT